MSDDEPDWLPSSAAGKSDDEPDWLPSATGRKSSTLDSSDEEAKPGAKTFEDGDEDLWDEDAFTPTKKKKVQDAQPAAASADTKPKVAGKSAPASKLSLVFAPKVSRNTILLECPDPSLKISGDVGSIGMINVSNPSGAKEEETGSKAVRLDIKGRIFDGDILQCNTLCVVSIGPDKAKVEAVMNDFVQLGQPQKSIFNVETVEQGDFDADFFANRDVDVNERYGGGDTNNEDGDGAKKSQKKTVAAKRKAKPTDSKGKGSSKKPRTTTKK